MLCFEKKDHRLYHAVDRDCPCVKEVESIALPKWPALLVIGERVTRDQAAEIIVRTDSFYFGCNDREWERQLQEAAGIKRVQEESGYERKDWNSVEEARKRFRALDLEYLHNSQIASAHIGGPHGWCGWTGGIYCDDHNIGKWPRTLDVYREWCEVAEAFPFLKLKCQLFSGESCEQDTKPLIQYNIEGGKVEVVLPPENGVGEINDNLDESTIIARLTNPFAERGCSIEQFKRALELARGNDL